MTKEKKVWLAVGGVSLLRGLLGLVLMPGWMFSKYPDAAALLRDGKLPPSLGADYSPLYLLMNLVLSPEALRLAQAMAGILTVFAVFLIGRRLVSTAAGFLSALLVSVSETLLLYESTLEPDFLIAAMSIGAIALLLEGRAKTRAFYFVSAGILIGLTVALRPTQVLFLGLVVFWGLWLREWKWASVTLLAALIFGAIPVIVVQQKTGSEVGATMSMGEVLHMGNRPESTGMGAQPLRLVKWMELQERQFRPPDYAHELYREFAQHAAAADVSSVQKEMYWMGRVWNFAKLHPLAFMKLWGRKALTFVAGPDGHDVADVTALAEKWSAFPLLSARLLSMLALAAGLWWAVQRRFGLLLGFWASLGASALLFYVSARYRVAAIPVCAVLGGTFLASLPQLRQKRTLALGAVLSCVGVWGLWQQASFLSDMSVMLSRARAAAPHVQGMAQAVRARKFSDAQNEFVQLQAAQPLAVLARDMRGVPWQNELLAEASLRQATEQFGETPADIFLLGVLAGRAGRWEATLEAADNAAAQQFRSAIFDVSLDGDMLASEALRHLGRDEEALSRVKTSLEKHPATLDGLSHALAASVKLGRTENVAAWENELRAVHDPLSIHFALAFAHNEWGNFEKAWRESEALLKARPDAAVALFEKARALLGLERHREALEHYDLALRAFPGRAFDDKRFTEPLAEWAHRENENPIALSFMGEHLCRQGKVEEGKAFLQQARHRFGSDFPAFHRERESFCR